MERTRTAGWQISWVAQEDLRIGVAVRRSREKRGLRQIDVAGTVGVSAQTVSMIERGHLDSLTVHTVRTIAAAVGIDLPFAPRGRGAQIDQLIDEEHSAMVDLVVGRLTSDGWEAMIEFSFNEYGDRGAVDVLAWRPETRTLLIVETKSRLANLGDACRALDVKARKVPQLAATARGWRAANVGVLLVMQECSRERAAVARRRATFDCAFPARNLDVREWLHRPDRPLRGLWFLHISRTTGAKRGTATPKRVGGT